MSSAANKSTVTSYQAPATPFFSAYVNLDNKLRNPTSKIPAPFTFNATMRPLIEVLDYPTQKIWRIKADHTEAGVTHSLEVIFFSKPVSGTFQIGGHEEEEDGEVTVTYYPNRMSGNAHRSEQGSLVIESIDETSIKGYFNGQFGSGGENGNDPFPISGSFIAEGNVIVRRVS
ncbi:hypothetical protein C9I50_23555 [Pseudomonas prosekii]|uniref:Uncharacterized protein n=1 Tax=Pseudomonas prosekii TaxID=1148509 RepID=A0A1H2BYK2_9PSED|nr:MULTISPECIES: hypothetical protein [Pseudomonas]PKH21504.1 hypothetical protein BI292_15345 [Pseudomonas sp. 43NM1]PWE38173.1 hypothetical protein C9I50_23555 [Pseudomonas prosekii]PWE43749.1 hypothetical protein C9I49_15725 [Pseudomonas prosekii]SDT63233.1 hypothetical protein SAMN05216222_5612 [Pseudomonas prosekii]